MVGVDWNYADSEETREEERRLIHAARALDKDAALDRWLALIEHENPNVLCNVVNNQAVPPEVLAVAWFDYPETMEVVAAHPRTPAEALRSQVDEISETDPTLMEIVARNPNLAWDDLLELCQHDDDDVREAAEETRGHREQAQYP